MENLSKKEKLVFDYIKGRLEDGYSPTVREICAGLGFKSTSSAASYVNTLVSKGYLEKIHGLKRAVKIAGRNGTKIPVMGKITAGEPITAVTNIEEYINFHESKGYQGELFALKISGESMINAAILDGDIVVVEQCDVVDNGTIAAVLIGEEATVKTFYKEDNHFRLQPENDRMSPIIVDDCQIIGKIVAVLRWY